MNANIKIGKIWGISVGLHSSWFLIFGLMTWSLAAGYFPVEYPQLTSINHWTLGVITSLLFFASVLAHELGHAFLALRNKIPVRGITLFIFGGVAQIGQEPRSPGAEFRIAIAGPLTSVGVAALFGGMWLLDRSMPFLAAPSMYLARINLILALFNMIPGFPLDGGRVLRSILWRLIGSFRKATRIAVGVGQLVAFGFIGFGVLTVFTGNLMNGLWLAFIGWFLQNAAHSASSQLTIQTALSGVKVGQVMSREFVKIPSLISLNQLVEEKMLAGGQRSFFVADNGQLLGMITLRDIANIPQQKWRYITTSQVMRPFDHLVHVSPESELIDAVQTMDTAHVAQLPVMAGGELVGILTRDQVLHFLRMRTELGV